MPPPPHPVHGDFFRLVRGPQATLQDVQSNKEKGRAPVGPEIGDDWEHGGISVFDSFQSAARKAHRMQGRLGWYAARLRVPPGAGVTGRHTKGGHWTLGPPPGQTASQCFHPLAMDSRPVPR